MPVLADLATEVMTGMYGIPRPWPASSIWPPAVCLLPSSCKTSSRAIRATLARLICSRAASLRVAGPLFMPEDTRAALVDLQTRGRAHRCLLQQRTRECGSFRAPFGFAFDLVMGHGKGLAKGRPHIELAERTFGVDRREIAVRGRFIARR